MQLADSVVSAVNWLGNILIILGLWRIGSKDRRAFLFSIAGETCWIVSSVATGNWALAFICTVFNVMAIRNFIKWGKTC